MTSRNLRLGLLLATALAVALTAAVYGYASALMVLAAGALLLGITLLWSSVQSLTGETPLSLEEALTLGAPTAEEEQKRALLRALKDLEYERSVGKIAPEDYSELAARYRQEAIRLMQNLDESLGPARERAEKLLRERLAREEEEARREQQQAAPSEDDDDEAPPSEPDHDEAPPSEPAASDDAPSSRPSDPAAANERSAADARAEAATPGEPEVKS